MSATPPLDPPVAGAPFAPGRRVGPYELIGVIGAGAMGEVWRARDPRLGRDVAIKVLPTDFARDPERLRRFEDEARAAGNLNHPNVVTVFDAGVIDGVPYVVQELLAGTTLREQLRQPVSPRRAAEWAGQVARGLAAAHEQGIVHRDLKPENLFVLPDGRVKVLDFGLAKLTAATPGQPDSLAGTRTEAGVLLGTAGYMSPEQARGEAADARSDLFALGVILHEMLSGTRPFQGGSSIETLGAILRDDPPPLPASVPPGLARIVERLLEKRPAARFQSALDLAFALESLSTGSEVGGRAAARGRRRVPVAALAIAAIAGAAIGAVVFALLGRTPEAPPPRVRTLSFSGHDTDPAVSPDGRTIAFSSDRDGVRRIWIKETAGGREQGLTPGTDASPRFSPDGSMLIYMHVEDRSNALYKIAVLGGEQRRILDDAFDPDWSPDGRSIAFVRINDDLYELWTAQADGSAPRRRYVAPVGGIFGPRWSPDGRRIAITRLTITNNVGTVTLVDLADSGSVDLPTLGSGGDVSSVSWLDDRTLTYAQSDGSPGFVRGRQSQVVVHPIGGRARGLLWMPGMVSHVEAFADGKLVLAMPGQTQNLQWLPLDGGTPRWLTRGSSIDRQPSFSDDGTRLLFSSNRSGNLDLWSLHLPTSTLERVTDDDADDWDPEVAPDGRSIWWSSSRSGVFEIWNAGLDGSGARQISRDSVDAENPTLGGDGRYVTFSTSNPRKAGLWRMRPDGSEATRIVEGNLFLPEMSPDGRFVAYGALARGNMVEVRVVRTEDGQPETFLARLQNTTLLNAVGRPRWRPDGRAILMTAETERGVMGLYEQAFEPGRDTQSTRRLVTGGHNDHVIESFGIAPDGRHIVLSIIEPRRTLHLAEDVPGIRVRPRSRRPS